VVSKTEKELSYTRLCKSLFLTENYLLEEHGQKPVYDFEAFMIHTGVFDNELIRDLQIWEFLGLLRNLSFPYDSAEPKRAINSHNIRLTTSGKDYVKRIAEPAIVEKFGKDVVKELRKIIVRYATEDESKLVHDANEKWTAGADADPQRKELVNEFLTSPDKQ
jgi:hypothetical protein